MPVAVQRLRNEVMTADAQSFARAAAAMNIKQSKLSRRAISRLHLVPACGHPPEGQFVSESLKSLEERLEPFGFVRCYKGHMINIRFLRRIEAASLSLSNGD